MYENMKDAAITSYAKDGLPKVLEVKINYPLWLELQESLGTKIEDKGNSVILLRFGPISVSVGIQ